jgi:hypothetical protein
MEAIGMKLSLIADRLGTSLDTALSAALAKEAEQLAASLREILSTPPGGPHSHPWQRSGVLRDSVEVETGETEAAVVSRDPVALYQENGTATLPPRPSFGPLAAVAGPGIAHRLGQIAHDAIVPNKGD